jgi:copper chaperone CopZ
MAQPTAVNLFRKSSCAAPEPYTVPGISSVMATFTLRIDNMHCGSCIRRVTQAINALPETHADEVRVGSARVQSVAAPEQLQQALTAAGYPTLVEVVSA